jgi:hypothetical protein
LNHLPISNLVSFNINTYGINETHGFAFISRVMTQSTLCKLNVMKLGDITRIPGSTPYSIIHLTMKSCSLEEYDFILQRSPHLRTIVTGEFIKKKSNTFITSYSASTQYPQLMSLVIDNSSLSMPDFEQLLSLTPSLVRLKLISYRNNLDSILDVSDLAHLIQTKLLDLKTFQFFFSYTLRQRNDAKDLDSLVDQFRTPFWLHEKKWIIICDYVLQEKVIHFYTTPRCTIDCKPKSTKTLQPSSLKIRFNSSSMDKDSHSVVRLMYAINDVTESEVRRKILFSKWSWYLANNCYIIRLKSSNK